MPSSYLLFLLLFSFLYYQLHHPPRAKAKTLARNFLDSFLCLSPDANQFRSFLMVQILKMLANSALPLCFHLPCLSLGSQPLLPGTSSFSLSCPCLPDCPLHLPQSALPPECLQNDLSNQILLPCLKILSGRQTTLLYMAFKIVTVLPLPVSLTSFPIAEISTPITFQTSKSADRFGPPAPNTMSTHRTACLPGTWQTPCPP